MRIVETFRGKPLTDHQPGLEQICMSANDLYVMREGKRRDFDNLRWMLADCNIPVDELAVEQVGRSAIEKLNEGQRMEMLMKGHVLTRMGEKSWPTPGGGASYHYEPAIRSSWMRMWFPSLSEANAHFMKVHGKPYSKLEDGTLSSTYAPPGCVESREYTRDRNQGIERRTLQRNQPLMVDWD